MAALALKLTDVGLAAVQGASGADPVTISHLGLTALPFDYAPTLTALPGEFKRVPVAAGVAAAPNITHLTAYDTSAEVWSITGFGLFMDDGALFAVYTGNDVIMSKAAAAFGLLAFDIAFQADLAANIAFGDAVFTYPPATELMRGVAKLATQARVDAAVDDGDEAETIVTPKTLRARLLAFATSVSGSLAALTGRTIAGAGLVTGGGDLSANRVLTVTEASAAEIDTGTADNTVVTPRRLRTVLDNVGSAIDALRGRTITGGGLVTGGGDLSASRVLTVTEASEADITAGTATDKVVTPRRLGPIAMTLAQNGYIRFFGLQIVWGRFTATANTTTPVVFAPAFQTACFSVVCSGVTAGGADSQDNPPAVITSTITKDGFSVFSADDSADGTCFIAVGT
jgi:hypothetical protein